MSRPFFPAEHAFLTARADMPAGALAELFCAHFDRPLNKIGVENFRRIRGGQGYKARKFRKVKPQEGDVRHRCPAGPEVFSDGCWRFQHHLAWEAANGAIPVGMVLICRTGDRTNSDPANWLLIADGAGGIASSFGLKFSELSPDAQIAVALLGTLRLRIKGKVAESTLQDRKRRRRERERKKARTAGKLNSQLADTMRRATAETNYG